MAPLKRFYWLDIPLQCFMAASLFYALTGGAFLISPRTYNYLSLHRWIFQGILCAVTAVGMFAGWLRWRLDAESFFQLEPVRSARAFFDLPPVYSVTALFLFYFAMQSASLSVMHAGLGTALWDLGYYEHPVWQTAHGDFMFTSLRGNIILGDHFKLMLAFLAPVYWLGGGTYTVLGIQAFFGAAVIPLVYLIARQVTHSSRASLTLAIAVFFYQPLRNAVLFPLHTQNFADPLLLAGFYFVLKNRVLPAFLFFILAVSCKQNIALDLWGLGAFLVYRRHKMGLPVAALGLGLFALVMFVLFPQFEWKDNPMNKWGMYSHLKSADPALWMRLLYPNPLFYLFLMLGPLLFLPLACPGFVWLLGPSLGYRLLSSLDGFRMITAHYNSGLMAALFIAASYGLARLGSRKIFRAGLLAAALCFAGTPAMFRLSGWLWEMSSQENQKIVRVLESVPERYSVLATQTYLAHLIHRKRVFAFLIQLPSSPLHQELEKVDLIIVDEKRVLPKEREVLEGYIKRGYSTAFHSNTLKVFEREPGLVTPELLAEWRAAEVAPERNYLKRFCRIYKRALTISIVLFILLICYRAWRPERVKVS